MQFRIELKTYHRPDDAAVIQSHGLITTCSQCIHHFFITQAAQTADAPKRAAVSRSHHSLNFHLAAFYKHRSPHEKQDRSLCTGPSWRRSSHQPFCVSKYLEPQRKWSANDRAEFLKSLNSTCLWLICQDGIAFDTSHCSLSLTLLH